MSSGETVVEIGLETSVTQLARQRRDELSIDLSEKIQYVFTVGRRIQSDRILGFSLVHATRPPLLLIYQGTYCGKNLALVIAGPLEWNRFTHILPRVSLRISGKVRHIMSHRWLPVVLLTLAVAGMNPVLLHGA